MNSAGGTKDATMAEDDSDLKQAMFQVSDGVIGAAVLIVIGVLAGNWLDGQLHSSPLWLIILSLAGGGLGLGRLIQKALQIGQSTNQSVTEKSESIAKDLPANRSGESQSTSQPRKAYEHFED